MGQYAFNLFFAIDTFASTILGGDPDDTISERLGRAYLARTTLSIPHAAVICIARDIVDGLALIVTLGHNKNHCVWSLTGNSGCQEVWSWGGTRVPKTM